MIIVGFHAIEAMLSEGQKISTIHAIARIDNPRFKNVKTLAQQARVSVKEYSPKDKARFEQEFLRLGGSRDEIESANGIFAQVPDFQYTELHDILTKAREKESFPVIVFLDEVTDPQNIGSILRSGAFFNISGLVITEHRAAPITAAAIKISSGGFLHVPVARVTNLAQALEQAKEAGFWIIGLSEHAKEAFSTAALDAPLALVIGNEEKGIRDLTKKTCDYTLSLPTHGAIKSLNAAVATAVSLTLVRERQRQIQAQQGKGSK
jgi:23S rRNA (guanosine2251-2'-O)-methyltransferase